MSEPEFQISEQEFQEFQACIQKLESVETDNFFELAKLLGRDLKTDLVGADLRETDLSNGDLSNADLSNSNLRGANLRNTNLRGADLSDANLQGALLNNVDLSGANLIKANLQGANLNQANLENANLDGSTLCGASLRRANLRHANLSFTNLSQADLREANLTGINSSDTIIDYVLIDDSTLLEKDLEARIKISQFDSHPYFSATISAGRDATMIKSNNNNISRSIPLLVVKIFRFILLFMLGFVVSSMIFSLFFIGSTPSIILFIEFLSRFSILISFIFITSIITQYLRE